MFYKLLWFLFAFVLCLNFLCCHCCLFFCFIPGKQSGYLADWFVCACIYIIIFCINKYLPSGNAKVFKKKNHKGLVIRLMGFTAHQYNISQSAQKVNILLDVGLLSHEFFFLLKLHVLSLYWHELEHFDFG